MMINRIYLILFIAALAALAACEGRTVGAFLAEEPAALCDYPVWTEFAANPLFPGGATNGTDRIYYPCVIKAGSTYHLWYGDGTNTRHAASAYPDFNDVSFNNPPGTYPPIVTGLPAGSYHPRVLYNASGWNIGGSHYAGPFLMYSTTGSDWNQSPRVSHSADGSAWTDIGPCTGVNSYGGNTSVYTMAVLYEGGTTWKAYADNGFGLIQYYTSTDGIDWTGKATDVLGATQAWEQISPPAPSSNGYTSVSVNKINNVYFIFYGSGSSGNNQGIGVATSPNGSSFTKYTENPLFHKDDGPAWRNDRTYVPFVISDGRLWRMYFTGRSSAGGIYTIGMALKCGDIL